VIRFGEFSPFRRFLTSSSQLMFWHLFHSNEHSNYANKFIIAIHEVLETFHPGEIRTHDRQKFWAIFRKSWAIY
jgi:hypothetical protein